MGDPSALEEVFSTEQLSRDLETQRRLKHEYHELAKDAVAENERLREALQRIADMDPGAWHHPMTGIARNALEVTDK